MALGARAGDLQRGILVETLRLAVNGMIIGLMISWSVGRAIQGLLFGITFADPMTFTAAAVVLTAIAALAGFLPARRATRVDPVDALRAE